MRQVWNKGIPRSEEVKRKISETKLKRFAQGLYKSQADQNNPAWKGDKVSYKALHQWVYRKLGKPKACLNCKSNKFVVWASISHKAKRDLKDYMALCTSCHVKYDNLGKYKRTLEMNQQMSSIITEWWRKRKSL